MKRLFKILTVIFFASFLMCVVVNVHADEVIEDADVFEDVPTEEVVEEQPTEPAPTEEVVEEQPEEETPVEEPEIETPTEEIVEEPEQKVPSDEPVVEEEITASEMIKNFINEWLIAIFATMGGVTGSALIILIGKGVISKMIESLEKSLQANTDGNENLKEAKAVVIEGLKQIESSVDKFEVKMEDIIANTSENINNCVKEINYLKDENVKFKELIALLVTSNPQLASNGYATKILELLNEGSESNE